jgi:nuclear pore complex protein Nup155
MSEQLAKKCPSWFSDYDRIKTSGFESLYTAINYPKSKDTEIRSYLETSLEEFQKITKGILENGVLEEICNLYSMPSLRFFKGIFQLCLSCARSVDPANIISHQIQKDTLVEDNELLRLKAACYTPIKKYLASLLQDDQDQAAYQELTECFMICKKSDDILFHHEFYQLQIDKGIPSDLIAVEYPYLESFLKSYCKPLSFGHELLTRYYTSHHRNLEAAKLMSNLAHQPLIQENPIPLEGRIVWLQKALVAARNEQSKLFPKVAIETKEKDEVSKFVEQIEATLAVAQVQANMKSELDFFPNATTRNKAKAQISEALYSIQDLFQQFALPFQLYESTLSLFKLGMRSSAEIKNIWAKIISNIMNTPRSTMTVVQALQQKVINLGQQHYPNDFVFPIDFLIDQLEQCNLSLYSRSNNAGPNVYWVGETFLQIQPYRVPYNVLIRNYWDVLNQWEKSKDTSEVVLIVAALCRLLLDYQLSLNQKEYMNYTSLRVDSIIDGIATIMTTYGPKESNLPIVKESQGLLKSIREENAKIQPVYRSTRFV